MASPEIVALAKTKSSLFLALDRRYSIREKRPPLRVISALTSLHPEDLGRVLSDRKAFHENFTFRMEPIQENLHRLRLTKRIRGKIMSGVAIVDSSYHGAWMILTNASSYFVNRVLEGFLDTLYPEVSRPKFNHFQIRSLMDRVKQSYPGQQVITSFVIRQNGGTMIVWKEEASEELMKQIQSKKTHLEHLSFDVIGEDKSIVLEATVSAEGVCGLEYGNFSMFYSKLVMSLAEIASDVRKFYSDRERRVKNGQVDLHPYVIKYSTIFSKASFSQLTSWLRKEYMCSVIHEGNPYYAAMLSDYRDGSSFGVTVLGQIVTITPIAPANPPALWRLTSNIQALFGEGEVADLS